MEFTNGTKKVQSIRLSGNNEAHTKAGLSESKTESVSVYDLREREFVGWRSYPQRQLR